MKTKLITIAALALAACAKEPVMKPIPAYPSAVELATMLKAGETSSEALVTELLARAEAQDALNAFISLNAAGALARARELDVLRSQGTIVGPLHGVPLVVKDNIHVAGLPNTAGTPGLADFAPASDNAVVAALRDAGAIILGKTNLHELAFGDRTRLSEEQILVAQPTIEAHVPEVVIVLVQRGHIRGQSLQRLGDH